MKVKIRYAFDQTIYQRCRHKPHYKPTIDETRVQINEAVILINLSWLYAVCSIKRHTNTFGFKVHSFVLNVDIIHV